MSRMVSVWLPHLPIERLKRERLKTGDTPPPDDRPFALVGSDTHGLTLNAVNEACRCEGLVPGMRLADARAICPRILTVPATPGKDAELLLALARWTSRYSPTLNVDGEDGLWLDITGVAHLFGGEHMLLADLTTRLARAGLTARVAAAETLGAAHALSRFERASPIIASDGALHTSLTPLPVEALRLEDGTVRLLRRLGLKRIGQLVDLPRASLEQRFHSKETAQAVLRRLDQAFGIAKEKRTPLLPESCFVARLSFTEPLISHDGVVAGLDRLAEDLCQTLSRAGQGARRISLWVARTDGSAAAIDVGLSAPSCVPTHLVRLLKDKIESIDMGFGVDLMTLAALRTETLDPAQATLTETDRTPGPERLIDTLVNRLGKRTVRRLFPRTSHIPELAQVTRGAFAGSLDWNETPGKPPRPLLLLAKPEPLQVMAEIPEGPPARFTWRRVSRRVIRAEGPERIAPEWWRQLARRGQTTDTIPPLDGEGGEAKGRAGWGDVSLNPQASQRAKLSAPTPTLPSATSDLPTRGRYGALTARVRDYYRIEDEDGCRYWVFREGLYQESDAEPPCWFLHGVFP